MKSKPNLTITVIKASLLYDLDQQKGKGKQDPFALIQLGNQKLKTKTAVNQGKNPTWNESQQFVYDPKNPNLKVSVFDADPQKKNADELIGEGILNLVNAETAPEWLLSVPLYKQSNDMGSLELSFDFIGKQKPPPKRIETEQSQQQQSKKKLDDDSIQSTDNKQMKRQSDFDYQTVNIEKQQSDLEEEIQKIKNKQYMCTLKYIEDSKLQAAIEKALNDIAIKNPKDQIEYFAECLLNFK